MPYRRPVIFDSSGWSCEVCHVNFRKSSSEMLKSIRFCSWFVGACHGTVKEEDVKNKGGAWYVIVMDPLNVQCTFADKCAARGATPVQCALASAPAGVELKLDNFWLLQVTDHAFGAFTASLSSSPCRP